MTLLDIAKDTYFFKTVFLARLSKMLDESESSTIESLKKSISIHCWENFQKDFESSPPSLLWWKEFKQRLDVLDLGDSDSLLANIWYDRPLIKQQTDEEEDKQAENPEKYEEEHEKVDKSHHEKSEDMDTFQENSSADAMGQAADMKSTEKSLVQN